MKSRVHFSDCFVSGFIDPIGIIRMMASSASAAAKKKRRIPTNSETIIPATITTGIKDLYKRGNDFTVKMIRLTNCLV